MKIGIVNFHCAHNYGAMLQAYALQQSIKNNGYHCEIIDFEPDVIMNGYKLWSKYKFKHPKLLLKTILNYKDYKSKYDIFEKFKNQYLLLSPDKYNELNSNNINTSQYRAVICGSDQIWNMDLNGGRLEYLLNFIQNPSTKKISYAASIGKKQIPIEHRLLMEKELETFDHISVREVDAVKLIKENFNIDAQYVLDPVFLLSSSKWRDIAKYPNHIKGDYILLYGLEENSLFEETFRLIKENTDLKIINISPTKKTSKYIDQTLFEIGPCELLGLLINSSIVLTNSFHGTCFSIIFEKDFITIGHSSLNSRIESILNITQLNQHMINTPFNKIEDFYKTCRFDNAEKVRKILQDERKKSKKFLFDAIEN